MASLRSSRVLRIVVLALAALVAVERAAQATWSIVVVNKKTGEVAIGCCTCLEGFDLEIFCPVMLVGVGGACAQSSIDSSGANRLLIRDRMLEGKAPVAILAELQGFDPAHQSRQYGIVDLIGRRQTFTGSGAGAWAGGVDGRDGSIYYAIQGNVLAGSTVVDDAEAALIATDGDVAEKLMAAMEAAHQAGGDGRCSCDPSDADRCGAPPPGFDPDLDKSAHVGFMMLSRIGDTDGSCNGSKGCANGVYYMNLNVANQTRFDEDPTLQLREMFDDWRESWRGRPDHILSTATPSQDSVPGNGTKQMTLDLVLNDWEANAIGKGGATVTVTHSANSAGLAWIGDALDHGDGTYSVPLVAGSGEGVDEFAVVVDDGQGPVTLYPFPTLTHTPTLTADVDRISAAAGGTVHFSIFGPETPPPDYLLLCSASGTSPGTPVGDMVVPLNLDGMVILSYVLRNSATFVNTDGALAPDGTSTAQFAVLPGDLIPIIGFELAFAYFTHGPVEFASNFVPLTIDP